MVEIRTGRNTFKKRNKRSTIAAYHYFGDGSEPIVFLKYGKCDCGEKLFDEDHIVHALEHEFVELACINALDGFTIPIRNGFDQMSFQWHIFTFPHSCEYVRRIQYG